MNISYQKIVWILVITEFDFCKLTFKNQQNQLKFVKHIMFMAKFYKWVKTMLLKE